MIKNLSPFLLSLPPSYPVQNILINHSKSVKNSLRGLIYLFFLKDTKEYLELSPNHIVSPGG